MSNFTKQAFQPSRFFKSKLAGPPTTGLWKLGDVVTDINGVAHRCTGAGAPGSWESDLTISDTVVDLTDAGAKFVAGPVIPAGAVILSAQANIDELVVAGGTTVKIGLGLNATDTDKYGISSALTANLKINTIPAHAVLSGAETIDVCGVTSAGTALGDTNISAGKVRVRVVYKELASLPNV